MGSRIGAPDHHMNMPCMLVPVLEQAVGSMRRFNHCLSTVEQAMTNKLEERPMLYEVAIVNVDKDGNVLGIAMPITAVVAEDRDAAIVEATRKLGADGAVVDTKAIRVLVRAFPG